MNMALDSRISIFDDYLNIFDELTRKPEKYLSVQNEIVGDIKSFVKKLYDYTKEEENIASVNSLPELIIEEFDDEQIWQELELQNDEKNSKFIKDVSHLVASKNKLSFSINEGQDRFKVDSSSENEQITDNDSEESSLEEDADIEYSRHMKKKSSNVGKKKKSKQGRASVVDDQFFKLHELETFLEKEDKKAWKDINLKERNKEESDDDDDNDDESIDLFQDEVENEEDRNLHYEDFFDRPELHEDAETSDNIEDKNDDNDSLDDSNNDVGSENEIVEENTKHVRFALDASSSSGEERENDKLQKSKSSNVKSSFEARQERIKSKIEQLEEKVLSDKPWQMKGEVSATTRPQNSLLEEALEFDIAVRPAPVITEETTLKLEDIIRQRIKDKVWDDVERKIKPVETPYEYKKKLVLDQEKSKLSLAEIYEQEYLKQREAVKNTTEEKPEEEPKEHKEITKMMTDLFTKLDALSNFHYIPKPIAPEVKIVSNLPAITVEEVAPVTVSDATLLAPEEIYEKPRGEIIGKNERTSTDKKRERRKKKKRQRERQKEKEKKEKLVQKLKPGMGNKYSKEKAIEMLDRATKHSNVSLIEGKSKEIHTSKTFFTQLQEEVDSHIKSKIQNISKRKKEKTDFSAKRLKL